MKLAVENFGPIKKGEIDLTKRFYMFVGYNNSGKTYMSQLMWRILQKTDKGKTWPIKALLEVLYWGNSGKLQGKLAQLLPEKWLTEQKEFQIEITQKLWDTYIDDFITNLEIDSLFRIDKNHFVINQTSFTFNTSIELFKDIARSYVLVYNAKDGEHNMQFSMMHIDNKTSKKQERKYLKYSHVLKLEKNVDSMCINVKFTSKHPVQKIKSVQIFQSGCVDIIVRYFHQFMTLFIKENYTFFLPANRIFYPSFYQYIYHTEKEKKNLVEKQVQSLKNATTKNLTRIQQTLKSPYTEAMETLNDKIFNLDRQKQNHDKYRDLYKALTVLMGGSVITKNVAGIAPNEFHLQVEKGKDLDMYLSSSAANQLTTLYLYFRHWAYEKDNFLIIDEPEENLHPKHQLALLDILMQFAQRDNNRVLITTHSPFLAEAVNNHLHLGFLEDKGIDVEQLAKENKLHVSPNAALSHDDMGVYFFNGETIEPYEVGNYGISFHDFNREQREVNRTGNILRNRIYEVLEKEEEDNA